ncbi:MULTISPECIES: hypothetical protein [unclassified Streptosporangium]|uniref:hypothetical protein n=1 Tax=unclassified Streptosporangium TaxID=2632669 RepID=UPI002E2E250D|nr:MULTISPECIES: hypothetical protein [unclassified Streptosporangium]
MRLTGVVILGYTSLFAITTWQAMRGQSLVHPDAATWTALAATVVVTALPAALAVSAARRSEMASAGDGHSPGAPPRGPVGSLSRDHTAAR